MSLPLNKNNLVGSVVYAGSDLSMPGSLLSNASASSNAAFSTGEPATVIVLAQLASGSANTSVLTFSSSTMANPVQTVATGVVSTTALSVITINTTAAAPYVGLVIASNGAATTYTTLVALVTYVLTPGENWHSCLSGHNAVASKVRGDGSGVWTLNYQ